MAKNRYDRNRPPSKPLLPLLLRAFSYLRPIWRTSAASYGVMLLMVGYSAISPQFIRIAIDEGITPGNAGVLVVVVAGLLMVTALRGVGMYWVGRWSEMVSQQVAYQLRREVMERLMALSFSYHDRSEAGQLLSKTMQDVERLRFLTGRAVLRLTEAGLIFVVTGAVLLWMDVRLGLLTLAMTSLLVAQSVWFGARYRPLSFRIQDQLGVLTTRLEQNLRGRRIVKAFAQEDAEIERFVGENERWFMLSAQATRLQAGVTPLLDWLINLGGVVVIGYGGFLVVNGELSLGVLVAFTTYLAQLAQPTRFVGLLLPIVVLAGAAAERIFDILDCTPEIVNQPQARVLAEVHGHVRLEGVSFDYLGRGRMLHEIEINAPAGSIVALLGATGSGKSTLINLIPRFYDPTEGRVTIDGHDLREIELSSLRRAVGIVLQESVLFADTIRNNIAFGKPDATEDEIIAAAQAAQAHEFISALPQGYDTQVGERGITLSGGQKQRIAIARALLTGPRILLLDDATASVDTETEEKIQAALDTLMEGRTTFVIAHRLSTVRRADQIIVLDKGRIAARGTHEELLDTSPQYRAIYEQQLRPQEVEAVRRLERAQRAGALAETGGGGAE